ncbi:biotin-dependent carboxyltransferase family protein [Gillisia sp. CAL575]|uniref:5-oxoprolinase subunit C family protein n=1 Tax=Gillisia sp. CAL575 TaxID=985255 RepID=UPI00039CD0D2|nr:biotin-dependent carboxyltransferase family protein [Gillisia sp. CAL575]
MAEIEVLHPGLYSSIQDLGRFNFRKFGVPLSGAMDSYSAKIANLILGNSIDKPVLEITQLGPKLKFLEASFISICGAQLSPKINDRVVLNNKLLQINKNDVLSFGKRNLGCRGYIGIEGGFISEKNMESYSWYRYITNFETLQKGMRLEYFSTKRQSFSINASAKIDSGYLEDLSIEVYEGPELNLLSLSQQKKILSMRFKVDNNNNRMAIQLQEPLVNSLKPIITGPVLPGTVQLTPSGKLIVLMRDCQTTGGYPRVLQLSEEGINTMAQKVIGDEVSFALIEIK